MKDERMVCPNTYECLRCKTLVNAVKKSSCMCLPKLLIVHLKRFNVDISGTRTKICLHVRCPLKGLILPSELHGVKEYDLTAVIYHHGGELDRGHYTTCVQIGGVFYDCNDEVVVRNDDMVKDWDIKRGDEAYILVYEQKHLESLQVRLPTEQGVEQQQQLPPPTQVDQVVCDIGCGVQEGKGHG